MFYLSRTNYLEGTVNCEGLDSPVLIQGLENQNRAVDGDHVAIQLLERRNWSAPAELILDDGDVDPGRGVLLQLAGVLGFPLRRSQFPLSIGSLVISLPSVQNIY